MPVQKNRHTCMHAYIHTDLALRTYVYMYIYTYLPCVDELRPRRFASFFCCNVLTYEGKVKFAQSSCDGGAPRAEGQRMQESFSRESVLLQQSGFWDSLSYCRFLEVGARHGVSRQFTRSAQALILHPILLLHA